MKTYFVRTRLDQSLVGIFCAASERALAAVIELMVEPADCEYLVLKANEGLFAEAQFVRAPSQEGKGDTIFLTNTPDEILTADPDELEGDEDGAHRTLDTHGELKHAMDEVIPPVLEPTEALMARLQVEEARGWVAFSGEPSKRPAPLSPKTSTPIMLRGTLTRMH
jgi:hypothetical protein